MNLNDFTFGAEVECIAASAMTTTDIVNTVKTAGVDAYWTDYPHGGPAQGNRWKVTRDGSVHGNRGRLGVELVSPILKGAEGRAELKAVLDAVDAAGFTVNVNCGLHVHVGVGGASAGQLKNLAKMYLKYADEFDSIHPHSRRGLNNRFTRNNKAARFAGLTPEQMDERFSRVASVATVSRLMNGAVPTPGYVDYRYHALNFMPLSTHGTVEFRQHSGTVNARKAVEWVKLVTGFVASAFTIRRVRISGPGGFAKLLKKTDATGAEFYRARRQILSRTSV